ncbi:MAG: DUF3500 domain-containing protein [Acidimicrobiales bacterium]
MAHWTEFGLNHMPHFSARHRPEFPPPLQAVIDERSAGLAEPFRGLTSDGIVRPGLGSLTGGPLTAGPSTTAAVTEAAQAFLAALDPAQRAKACFPLDAEERRTWLNVHMYVFRHGVMLEDLAPSVRRLALDLLAATLSPRGFGQARDIMRLNRLLAEVANSPDEFGEWPYFVSIFGEPGGDAPWAWQIDGHHLCLNATVVGDRLVITPTFMGSEPCHVFEGPLAGTSVFVTEERAGLDLIRSLDAAQAAKAIIRPSIHPDDLPGELQHPFDGRMLGGAFHDNAVVPYEGVCAAELSDAQRRNLLAVAASFVGWAPEGHSNVAMGEVAAHLDETYFTWMGAVGDDGPFYYRVQSPVVFIEFDHHPGVVFDNRVPSRNHIHTVLRTPNGGDYGHDLLRRHHDHYDHAHGTHVPR